MTCCRGTRANRSQAGRLPSFEGAEDIAVASARGLVPDPAQTVAEWADRHRILSSRAASNAEPYRTSRTPYLKAIMEGEATGLVAGDGASLGGHPEPPFKGVGDNAKTVRRVSSNL